MVVKCLTRGHRISGNSVRKLEVGEGAGQSWVKISSSREPLPVRPSLVSDSEWMLRVRRVQSDEKAG